MGLLLVNVADPWAVYVWAIHGSTVGVPVVSIAGLWTIHGSPIGRAWVCLGLTALAHGSSMVHPCWYIMPIHGSLTYESLMGRPWVS